MIMWKSPLEKKQEYMNILAQLYDTKDIANVQVQKTMNEMQERLDYLYDIEEEIKELEKKIFVIDMEEQLMEELFLENLTFEDDEEEDE
jgi:hypothetical protein